MTNLLHARFWHYDGNHSSGHDCKRYDPHGFGLDLIATMAYVADDWDQSYGSPDSEVGQLVKQSGASLDGVVVRHHKGDNFGHQVHVAATAEQWEAVKRANQMFTKGEESRIDLMAEENPWVVDLR